MWIHMLTEPVWGPQLPASMVPNTTYGELHPGSSWVPICLRNLSAHPIIIPTKVVFGKVTPTNKVPPEAIPAEAPGELACYPQKYWILEELNLQSLKDWLKRNETRPESCWSNGNICLPHSDLDLGKTSPIKHWIKLTDQMPFKECSGKYPPHV